MSRPLLGFSPRVFARRRDRVRQALGRGVLILPSAPLKRRSRDTEYRYRPDSDLFYLTGSVEPEVIAVLEGGDTGSFSLFVPTRDPETELWYGRRLDPAEMGEMLGADAVHPLQELEDRLPSLLRPHPRVFFRLGFHSRTESLVLDALAWARSRGARTGEGPRTLVDPGEVLDDLRLVKDPEEISRIRKAVSLTVSGFREAMESVRPGMGEWELEALLESAFRRGGGRGAAFPTIVGSGENGCTLHYVDNEARIEKGELVLLDGGGELDLYSADVTRTFPADGTFDSRQREVYEVVLAAHRRGLERVRPGVGVGEVHQAVLEGITEGLVELGILQGSVPELLDSKAYEPFFPHKSSHWLGLDVHDVGDYALPSGPRLLEPGMVLTLEPGLYFPSTAFPAGHRFAGMGVRIEDDLLVTEDGVENLTLDLPVRVSEVEALVGSHL